MIEMTKGIKAYLQAEGRSQVWLARQIGMSNHKLNLSLNGKRKLMFDEYARICGALGVNTDFFLKPQSPEKQK